MTRRLVGSIIDPVSLAESYSIEIGSGVLFAILCAVIAPGRGRSALAWFFLGLLFSCVALIILLLLPDLKAADAQERHTENELRRLREQIKKERLVADARHEGNDARLEVHDRALGVDTSAPSTTPILSLGEPGAQWFLATAEERFGPFPGAQVRQLLLEGRISRRTLVWREGMTDWLTLAEVPELN